METKIIQKHKKQIVAFIGVFIILVVPHVVFAQSQTGAFANAAGFQVARDPRGIAALLVNTGMMMLGMAFMASLIWGSYLIMTGGGKEDRLDRGKRVIATSTLGIIIMLGAYGITRFVIYMVDYGANRQPNVLDSRGGFSIDIQTTDNNNIPADPLYDRNITGHENDFVDPNFYR